jgi:hypothetical protein
MLSALAMDHQRIVDCDHLHDAYLTKPIKLGVEKPRLGRRPGGAHLGEAST